MSQVLCIMPFKLRMRYLAVFRHLIQVANDKIKEGEKGGFVWFPPLNNNK